MVSAGGTDKMEYNRRIGIILSEDLLCRCDRSIELDNSRSRSEFICNAIEFYIAWLNNGTNHKVLTPALESVIGAKIKDTENRIARVIFKQGVEIAMMMHVVAASNDISPADIEDLRKMCVSEVSRNNGRYTFEDAVRFQKS